jgi:hypothetical protein
VQLGAVEAVLLHHPLHEVVHVGTIGEVPLLTPELAHLPVEGLLGGVWLMKALLGWGLTTGLGAGVLLQP